MLLRYQRQDELTLVLGLLDCYSDVVAICLFCFLNSKLTSFKSKSSAKEFPSGSQSSSKSSAAKIRVLNHKDYNTWKV